MYNHIIFKRSYHKYAYILLPLLNSILNGKISFIYFAIYECLKLSQIPPNNFERRSIYEPLNCRVISDLHGNSEWGNGWITMGRTKRGYTV